MNKQQSVLICSKREELEGDPDHCRVTFERHALVEPGTPGGLVQRDEPGVPWRLVEVALVVRARKPVSYHPGRAYLVSIEELEG